MPDTLSTMQTYKFGWNEEEQGGKDSVSISINEESEHMETDDRMLNPEVKDTKDKRKLNPAWKASAQSLGTRSCEKHDDSDDEVHMWPRSKSVDKPS